MPKYLTFFFIFIILQTCIETIQAAVLVKEKTWSSHSVLNVVFLDGNAKQKEVVQKYAPLWLDGSGLKFQFYNNLKSAPKETHIRISFNSHTASRLGNHGDYLSKTATLLLDQLNQSDLDEETIRRLVLHEFGHALGFEHEYRNPKWPYGIETTEEQTQLCIPRMKKLDYSLEKAQIKCLEINQILNSVEVHSTVYDENSIMNYPLRIQLPNNQFKNILAKSRLSVLDKLAIQQWYKNNKSLTETF